MAARSSIALLAAGVVLAAATAPRAAGADSLRPRPSDIPAASVQTSVAPSELRVFNDFATPERTYARSHVVVHYVDSGIDAPPLNDDDRDAVPDYVERVAEAGDGAIEYFARRGFRPIRPDTGGPDERPDVYVSRFTPGILGVALPAAQARGGAFVAVSNALDPSPTRSFGSVYGTVAHELFHLTQFSYTSATAEPNLPWWVLEGAAAAMESRVHPELDDLVSTLQLRRWYAATHRSITTQTYGAQRLWKELDRRYPSLLSAYLERLGASPGRSGEGVRELTETFRRVTGDALGSAFHRFALDVAANDLGRVSPVHRLHGRASTRASVAPLAIHFIRLSLPRTGSYEARVRVVGAARPGVSLVYELSDELAGHPSRLVPVPARVSHRGGMLRFAVSSAVRRSARFRSATLVVSNGGVRPAAYAVSAR